MEKAIFAPKTKSDKRANRKIYSNIESMEKQFSDGLNSNSRITELFDECILIVTGRLLDSEPSVYLSPRN
jgi:hypothetical protein